MYSPLLYELTLSLDKEMFNKQLDRAIKAAGKNGRWLQDTDFGYVDESHKSKGIRIAYHDGSKKKKIRLIVNPCLVVGNDTEELWKPTSDNISRLLEKLDKRVASYFHSEYELNNFKLSRVNLAVDIDVGSRERVEDYIKVLWNIGKVKLFSPAKYDDDGERIDKDHCFALEGNTNNIVFLAYVSKHDKEALRVEVRLTKQKLIRAYTNEVDTSSQLIATAKNSRDILMDTFTYIIPPGDFYKKGEAEKLIREKVSDSRLRRKMLNLLELIPKKKSVHLAIKALNVRDIADVIVEFEAIGVNPVSISWRHGVKKLKSLYSYL